MNTTKLTIDNIPEITHAFLILTESCNLKCRYCFVNQNPKKMTLQIAMDTVKWIISNSEEEAKTSTKAVVPGIAFFGGEPTLMWDEIIVPITDYVRKEYQKPFSLGMTTNGILLTKERLDYMKQNEISMLFSIDGNKKTQDYNRPTHSGESSFDKLEDIIKLIPEYFPTTTFRSTVIPDTVADMFENFKFAIENNFSNVFQIPNVFENWSSVKKGLLKKQLRLISDYYIESYRKNTPTSYSPIDTKISAIKMINKAIKYNSTINYSKCGMGIRGACAVGPTGTLYGCQQMTTYCNSPFIIGDIYNGLNKETALKIYQQLSSTKLEGKNCKKCKLESLCNGGCISNNYLINKAVNVVPPIYCYWEQLLLDEAIYICNILGTEKNMLFKEKFFSKG